MEEEVLLFMLCSNFIQQRGRVLLPMVRSNNSDTPDLQFHRGWLEGMENCSEYLVAKDPPDLFCCRHFLADCTTLSASLKLTAHRL